MLWSHNTFTPYLLLAYNTELAARPRTPTSSAVAVQRKVRQMTRLQWKGEATFPPLS